MQSAPDTPMEPVRVQYHSRIRRHRTNQVTDVSGLFAACLATLHKKNQKDLLHVLTTAFAGGIPAAA